MSPHCALVNPILVQTTAAANWWIHRGKPLKDWCFQTVVLKKTLERPLDSKEIKPVNPKGNQHWIFTTKTDAKAEVLILWPPDVKSWLIGKAPDAGKDWRQEEKGTTEDEMVGWHHWLNGLEFEEAPGVGDGQGGLACCSPWGHSVGHDWATGLKWIMTWQHFDALLEQSVITWLKEFLQMTWNKKP